MWREHLKRALVIGVSAVTIGAADVGRVWAFDIEGFPGSTWGRASLEKADIAGPGMLGYVNQGIDWITLPAELTLNTFAEFRYQFRTENKEFYNAYGPAIGVELRRSPLHLGVDYYWERYPELNETDNRLQLYLSWFYDWDLRKQ